MSAAYQRGADSCLQFANCIGLPAAAEGLNFVFSPLSIWVALSLAAAGSKDQTLHQFLSFLGSPTAEDLNAAADRLLASVRATGSKGEDGGGGSHLSFVNGVWVDQSLTLKPSFQEIAASAYDAAAKPVDFRRKVISHCPYLITVFKQQIIKLQNIVVIELEWLQIGKFLTRSFHKLQFSIFEY